eukprot:9785296-Lingulodinium_polyedra.AAC.1
MAMDTHGCLLVHRAGGHSRDVLRAQCGGWRAAATNEHHFAAIKQRPFVAWQQGARACQHQVHIPGQRGGEAHAK